ncbi:MAG: hypothetical protein AB7O80_02150 [Acetobacteraceae bacterium]
MMSPKRRSIARNVPTRKELKASDRPPALPDVPDIRDLPYQPTLRPMAARLLPPADLAILDQGQDGACTGFALAAVVNLLIVRNTRQGRRVSPHMLYRMAKMYDEWPGEDYEGSSLRGALRGFFNNGACADGLWGKTTEAFASLAAAKDARRTALGAYFRLRPVLSDYHAALNETGVIYASAGVHSGWDNPPGGNIPPKAGGPLHAFAIVGYDETGFWVQNSWGADWGKSGVAHWSYQDWAANIQDAWVLQLAIEAPEAFGLTVRSGSTRGTTAEQDVRRARPTRSDIAGHFVHVRNGDYACNPPYWSTQDDVEATANLVAQKTKHRHLMIYAHGGLNSPDAAAARTAAMANVFLENGIYPYAIFYDTGLLETLKDVILGRGSAISERSGGLLDMTDVLIEQAVGDVGTRLWSEMKADATVPFNAGRDGERAIRTFVDALAAAPTPTSLHIVGHSTGAILLGNLLACLDRLTGGAITVETCTLLAPACTIDFYRDHYHPRLAAAPQVRTQIRRMTVYNLDDVTEQADQVTWAYNKSLLYLVSNAFEDMRGKPLLGMQKFASRMPAGGTSFIYAAPSSVESNSTSHGGFDNDPATMNGILRRILQAAPERPFTARDLDY